MDKFVFSMWTYNGIGEFTPDEIDVWADLGMNIPMLPSTVIGRDDPKILIPWLDHALELGVKLIVNYSGMGYNEYSRLGRDGYVRMIKPLYDALAGHPAVHGFCIGDEPSDAESLAASLECLKINKELAPHLTPYLNYTGNSTSFGPAEFGGTDLAGWMKRVHDETGTTEICFDEYAQTINEGEGKSSYLATVSKFVEAGKAAGGSDVWGCLLSSGHHVFSPQREVDYRWQINTAAALGLRGVLWFRLYDRATSSNEYYGSPIDEFGTKTEGYYALRRCQRRFSYNFGEIIMKLRHKKTYHVKSDRGVFPTFGPGCHDVIDDITANDDTLVSFFDGEDGFEYLAVVDLETRFYGAVKLFYDHDRFDLYGITQNGASESLVRAGNGDEIIFMPAGMQLFRIVRK